MVKQIKEAGVKTSSVLTRIYEVIVLGATAAAAVKVATIAEVQTNAGNLPIWQMVAAILLAGVAYKLYQLQSK